MTRRERIEAEIEDLVSRFLYYDRKEDQNLPRGEIQAAIEAGEIYETDIVNAFEVALGEGLR